MPQGQALEMESAGALGPLSINHRLQTERQSAAIPACPSSCLKWASFLWGFLPVYGLVPNLIILTL